MILWCCRGRRRRVAQQPASISSIVLPPSLWCVWAPVVSVCCLGASCFFLGETAKAPCLVASRAVEALPLDTCLESRRPPWPKYTACSIHLRKHRKNLLWRSALCAISFLRPQSGVASCILHARLVPPELCPPQRCRINHALMLPILALLRSQFSRPTTLFSPLRHHVSSFRLDWWVWRGQGDPGRGDDGLAQQRQGRGGKGTPWGSVQCDTLCLWFSASKLIVRVQFQLDTVRCCAEARSLCVLFYLVTPSTPHSNSPRPSAPLSPTASARKWYVYSNLRGKRASTSISPPPPLPPPPLSPIPLSVAHHPSLFLLLLLFYSRWRARTTGAKSMSGIRSTCTWWCINPCPTPRSRQRYVNAFRAMGPDGYEEHVRLVAEGQSMNTR